MSELHKVFLSYHHGSDETPEGDWRYRDRFESLFYHRDKVIISRSVQPGDISDHLKTDTIRQQIRDNYLRDSSVTVVLVGARTWQRKHVDWEIASSLRDTTVNPRSGLVGILLPTYPGFPKYGPHTIPPRLNDNLDCGYAKLYKWTENPEQIKAIVHAAFLRRRSVQPNNRREPYGKNRSGERWS